MVKVATPVRPAQPCPTLATLVEAQQAHSIFAFDLKSDDERLARLRRHYARKLVEYNTFCELFEESALDVEFKAGDGRQLTLRLSMDLLGDAYAGLRDALSENLRSIEQEIVGHLQSVEQEAEFLRKHPLDESSPLALRASILALCASGNAV